MLGEPPGPPRPPPLARSADKALRVRDKSGVRLFAYAALLPTALALAGCGSDVDVELVWGGPPDAGAGGVVSTEGFADYQESVDEAWERSPAMAAAEFLRLDERRGDNQSPDRKWGAFLEYRLLLRQ